MKAEKGTITVASSPSHDSYSVGSDSNRLLIIYNVILKTAQDNPPKRIEMRMLWRKYWESAPTNPNVINPLITGSSKPSSASVSEASIIIRITTPIIPITRNIIQSI